MTRTREGQQVCPPEQKGLTRRTFLKAGAGVAGIAVLAACTPNVTTTSPTSTPPTTPPTTTRPTTSTPPTTSPPVVSSPVFQALQYFDSRQAAIIHAAAGRIIPGTTQDPGAKEAAVVVFIDRALAGYDIALQPQYIGGIEGMDGYANGKYSKGFAALTDQQQDDILSNMEKNSDEAKKYIPGAPAFFAVLLTHVRQGMFSDPVFGGNQNAVGWKLLGHPGIVFGRPPAEQACDFAVPKEYMGDQEFYASH